MYGKAGEQIDGQFSNGAQAAGGYYPQRQHLCSYEDGSDYQGADGTRVAVRVYERYSWLGGNRVSMNLTLVGSGENLFLSVITSGGSQGVFFKVNTWGEESFLDTIRDAVDGLGGRTNVY